MIPAAVPVIASVGDWEKSALEPIPEESGDHALARPKSSTFTSPSAESLTFAGLRSRWTMPFSWAASSASAIRRAIAIASSTGSRPRRRRSARSSPSTSSMAMRCTADPSARAAVSHSYRWAMLGWLSCARSFASRSKRARRVSSAAKAGGSTLRATSRSSRRSVARKTSPMPPRPIAAVIR